MKMRHLLPVCLTALCACSGPTPPETYYFTSRPTGIDGSYSKSVYTAEHIKASVGEMACVSGRLSSYQEDSSNGDRVSFAARCNGAPNETGVASYTMNETTDSGHLTASRGGALVQEKL